MGELLMPKQLPYTTGVEVEVSCPITIEFFPGDKTFADVKVIGAFGRTDYMYIKEVSPWAYDAVLDVLKCSIDSAIALDIADDWARELGQVDLARYAGAAVGLLNPVHVGVTVAGAIVDPRDIRALTALDVVSAAQSGVWSVGRTWTLTALDIVSAAQSGVWSVGRTWALAIATDGVAAQVSNWPALYAMNLTQYLSAACGLLNPIHVGITVSGAIVDPRQIRALTASDVVTVESLTKWGGTPLAGRDISGDLALLQPCSSIGTIADVTGNSAAQQLVAASTPCKAVVVRALAANTNKWRIGDSSVSASRGAELSARDAIVLAVDNVNKVYGYGVSPDKVSLTYVN